MSLVLDLLFPCHCYGCGSPDTYFCPSCQSKLVIRAVRPRQRISLFRYHGPVKQMVHDLKFEFVTDLVPALSSIITRSLLEKFPHIVEFWREDNFVMIPVPLHPYRENWRGFNQTELVFSEVAANLRLKFNNNLIIRTKNTLTQSAFKHKADRHSNVSSAFVLSPPCLPAETSVKAGQRGIEGDWNIILCDDVYTTGATIKSLKSLFPQNTDLWTLTIA